MDADLSRAVWHKSTRSNGNGGACVEVARIPGIVAVRDSKNPDGPFLTLEAAEWRDFIADAKAGGYDLA